MADTKISALTDGSTANSTDRLPAARTTDGGITWSNVYVTPGYIKTATIGAGSVSIASGKTFTASNTLTLAGTDSTTMTFPSTSATIARTDAGNTFTGAQTFSVGTVNGTGLDISQTWTGTGTYTGLKYNVGTDSGPANAASLLLDLQVGGASRFNITKAGNINTSGNLTISSGSLIFLNNSTVIGNNTTSGTAIGTGYLGGGVGNSFILSSDYTIAFTNGAFNATGDLFLRRAAAATFQFGAPDTSASTTVTITIATPGVVTWSSHGLSTGTPVIFSTTGALPTGITAGTTYYVIVINENTFQIATSYANATAVSPTAVNTSGSQSGTHTGRRGAVNQVFRVQSASGTLDFPGADFTIQGSRGTGTGAGGSIIFQVAPAVSSGTAQNAYSTALTIDSNGKATFKPTVDSTRTFEITNLAGSIIVEVDSTNRRFNAGGGGGAFSVSNGTGATTLYNAAYFGWQDDQTASSGTTDVRLYRDTTSTLALRNGGTSGTPVPQTFRVYNWGDASNGEYIETFFTSNVAYVRPNKNGTGAVRDFQLGSTSSSTTIYGGNASSYLLLTVNGCTLSSVASLSLNADYGNNKLTLSSAGVTVTDAVNIIVGTTTGTKIGTATSQKIGFWNATPIVQPTTTVAAATVAATGTGDVVAASTTFDGYTIPQIVKAMRNAGLLA